MQLTMLQLVLHRMISAALALCMVVAFNLPTANPAVAFTLSGQVPAASTQPQGLRSVLFAGEHQDAAYTAGTQAGITITAAELAQMAGFAAAQWPGWSVAGAAVFVQDLPGDALAITSGNSIAVDPTAAGWGWSATMGAPAPGTMDLFTVLAHEYGHIAGYADIEGGADLMTRTLSPGERRFNSEDRLYPAAAAEAVVAEPAVTEAPAPDAPAPDAVAAGEPAAELTDPEDSTAEPAPATDPVPATADPAAEVPAAEVPAAGVPATEDAPATEAPAVGLPAAVSLPAADAPAAARQLPPQFRPPGIFP